MSEKDCAKALKTIPGILAMLKGYLSLGDNGFTISAEELIRMPEFSPLEHFVKCNSCLEKLKERAYLLGFKLRVALNNLFSDLKG